jgi:hypothetical protein
MITSKIFAYIILAFFIGFFFGLFVAWFEKRWLVKNANYWHEKYLEADKRSLDLINSCSTK